MFWGKPTGAQGVKALGIENPWGNLWRRIDGWHQGNAGHTLIKLCKGTGDGTTASNFSDVAAGYIDIYDESLGNEGYISKMKYDTRGFRYPIACAGSETTYYADYKWGSTNCVALVGGYWKNEQLCGMYCVRTDFDYDYCYITIGSSPSCQSKEELSA